ncbi:hypothetical protein QWM81_04405 [Streptomyces ficellus]|uniref:MarR family transcriptional regulator n=1 Tax=Streptomyces ficellus TaxID=1977088 RepID=A0ABT7Z1D7_9ACTN|nr:hypothetical protein [Streptomyces ficellus]MDN3293302.1 hypothetical protein [Streptomyces ficellus]
MAFDHPLTELEESPRGAPDPDRGDRLATATRHALTALLLLDKQLLSKITARASTP